MAVLVVGCGSIGSQYAAALTKVTEVWAYDASAAHVDAINKDGLRITGAEEMIAPVKATTDPAALADVEIEFVLIATKSVYTRQAMQEVAPYLKGQPVASMQNGLGNEAIICEEVDAPVLRGIIALSAEVLGPGHVQRHSIGSTYLGPYISDVDPKGPRASLEQAERIGARLNEAGLETKVMADLRGALWAKVIMNSTVGPVRILTGLSTVELAASETAFALMTAMVEEGTAAAEKLGFSLEFNPLYSIERARELGVAPHRGSLTHDFEAGRPTEIDFLTGALADAGERAGVPMPTCRTVYQLFKGREAARANAAS